MIRNFQQLKEAAGDGMFMLVMDGKHLLLRDDQKLVTIGGLYRSKQDRDRGTGMNFNVAHFAALMQGIMPEESTEATAVLLRSLISVIREEFKIDLTNRVASLGMDDAAGFEAAMRQVFPRAVHASDYYHIVQNNNKNLHSGKKGKLRLSRPPRPNGEDNEKEKWVDKCKAHIAWMTDETRPISNGALFHIVWKLTLEKINSVWADPQCAEYLLNERLTLDPAPTTLYPEKEREMLTFTVNGKEKCGTLGAKWRSSISVCPPMAASGSAGGESYHRQVKSRLPQDAEHGKVLHALETQVYPTTPDCSLLSPKPSSFPQEWNSDCLRQEKSAAEKKVHGVAKPLPGAEDYVKILKEQKENNIPVEKHCVRRTTFTFNKHKADVYVMHR